MSYLDDATEAMTIWWDETTWIPFVEAENGNITGPGHRDKAAFAADVTSWEKLCEGSDPAWTADDVAHLWVIGKDGWETWHVAPKDAPGAVPVTCIWGKR